MKIAIFLFGSKVSPWFDLSSEFWMITEKDGEVFCQEKISLENLTISQRIKRMAAGGEGKGGIIGIFVDEEKCAGCGACVEKCPGKALSLP